MTLKLTMYEQHTRTHPKEKGKDTEFSKYKPNASTLTACFCRKSSYSIDQKRKRGEQFHCKDRGTKHNSLTYGMQLTLRCRKTELWDLFLRN